MEPPVFDRLKRCLAAEELVALATVLAGPGTGRQMIVWPAGQTFGDLGAPRLNQRVALHAEQALASFKSGRQVFQTEDGTVDLFCEVLPPPPKLVLVGAVHVAIPLVALARQLGFRTVVVDPRSAFATPERFPAVDRLSVAWPAEALADEPLNEGTYFAVLSHDLKIDLPALEIALRKPVRYVGALGSKKTHAKRVTALEEAGFTAEEIGRIHAPIGLDLGGRRAEEIALAILAEVVAVRHGKS